MFAGRLREIERLEALLLQTVAGQPENFTLTGERGIGKSSLLNYFSWVAKGDIPVETRTGEERTVRCLVIDVDLDQNTTLLSLIKKIELSLRNELGQAEPVRNFLSKTWEFLSRIEAAGYKLGDAGVPKTRREETLFDEFSYSLADTVKRVCGLEAQAITDATFDAVLLMIDEADNASRHLGLGAFAKLLSERLARRSCDKFMMGFAGLPKLRDVLRDSHPSSLRIFEQFELNALPDNDVSSVIDRCLAKANEQNDTQTTITDQARQMLVRLSEGYPHFIQQFGYCAFESDSDGTIDRQDVMTGSGLFDQHGALDIIGERYYRDAFYTKIRKESYRQVLRIMAESDDDWITKAAIRSRFKGKADTLDNAIHALLERRIILPKEGHKGVYRLQHRGFALWIALKTAPEKDIQQLLSSPNEVENGLIASDIAEGAEAPESEES